MSQFELRHYRLIAMIAIPSFLIVRLRRHPSRLPFGSLRSAWTGPGRLRRRLLRYEGMAGSALGCNVFQTIRKQSNDRTRAHEKENPPNFYAVPSSDQSAMLVRGGSRRITTVRFRPADIRVIHRRNCFSFCHSLCLAPPGSFFEEKPGGT